MTKSQCIYGVNMEENKIIEEVSTEETQEVEIQEENKLVEAQNHTNRKKHSPRAQKKDFILSIVITLASMVVIVAVIFGCIFGIAGAKAKEQINVEMMEGEQWSKMYLCQWLNNRNDLTNSNLDLPAGTNKYELIEFDSISIDKDLKVERPIENSHYTYTYTFVVRDEKYNVTIDARSGAVLSVEIA